MGQQPLSSGEVGGTGSATFNIELTLYYTVYITFMDIILMTKIGLPIVEDKLSMI